jgi:hypothetical protein
MPIFYIRDSQDAFRRAASRDKSLHIVEGATHIAMYDTPEFVKEAMAQLVPLYQNVGPLSAHAATDVAASAALPAYEAYSSPLLSSCLHEFKKETSS